MTATVAICLALLAADPDAAGRRPVDFATEIIPVLTRAGCNAGACHGAAAGRGGMHLSLLGADPGGDYETIVHALEGRRIHLVSAEQSLLIRKPTGQADHGGGQVLDEESPGTRRLLAWIRAGVPRTSRGVGSMTQSAVTESAVRENANAGWSGRRLVRLTVTPQRKLWDTIPAEVPLNVAAEFDDGEVADVTEWTVFTSSDSAAVQIDARFIAHVKRRGQHVVIARFLDRVIPIQLAVPLTGTPVDFAGLARSNFIDEEVFRVLSELRVPVSASAEDGEFLRRVTLDLTGRLPELIDTQAYLADSTPDKRARRIDALLQSEEFVDYWTFRFARLLQIHSLPNEKEIVTAYGDWLRRQLRAGNGLDQMVRELLTATGDSHQVGPANFGRMVADARGQAELVGRAFLGVRLECANCHNHPLDKWTQDDYHGLAAVFARVDRGRVVRLASRGGVTNLRTNEPAVPRIPGVRDLQSDRDNRAELAAWLTSSENRQFSRAAVNRLWRAMFGRGLVEPDDDLRDTNPATHPELLDRLAEDFVAHGFDIRRTLRQIALSQTYGRSSISIQQNAADDRFYSHAYRRELDAEVLLDAIADVTGVANRFPDSGEGARALHLIDPLAPAPSLDALGRCSRAAGCDQNASRGALASQLHLLNGELINQKLIDPSGRLQQLIREGRSNREIIDEFLLRAFCRPASNSESTKWQAKLASDDPAERRRRLEDFVWSLLNSGPFTENH